MFKFSSLWLQPLSVPSFLKPSYTLRLVLLTHQYSANIKGVMFAEYCCELLCEAGRTGPKRRLMDAKISSKLNERRIQN